MLSHRLTPEERHRLRVVCMQLDGVPFVEKAEILRASVAQMMVDRYSVLLAPVSTVGQPASRAA